MSVREIVSKVVGFGLTAVALIAGGILVLVGPHAYNDYLNVALGVILILFGLGAGGFGTMVIAGVLVDERARQREERLHVTPRSGPPAPPPPWGMGDIGRPGGGGVAHVGDSPRGGGRVSVVSVVTRNWDGPVLIVALIAWTVVALLIAAPR